MTILLSDPAVAGIAVRDDGEPLTHLDPSFLVTGLVTGRVTGRAALVRVSVARRLEHARSLLPHGVHLRVIEGYRTAADQAAIIDSYAASLRRDHPDLDEAGLRRLGSRYVAPLDVAPHVAGAAVDLTLVDDSGHELWLGSALDATPEESGGACYTDAPVDPEARAHRALLASALGGAGLVNYPTEWWHWSFGDRYWALATRAPAALFGPVGQEAAA